MKKTKKIFSVFLCTLLVVSSMGIISTASALEVTESALKFYVSPDGDDSAAGTIDAPFATVKGARDAIRILSSKNGLPDGGITVYIREGIYRQTETLEFTSADSGTEACPITYKSYEGETAVITGGYVFDTSKFETPSDEILARMLTEDAKANLKVYDLGAEGVDYTTRPIKDGIDSRLYIDGVRGWPGRYPNDERGSYGYLHFSDLSGLSFVDSENRVANWDESSISTARLYGMFEIDWSASRAMISKYDEVTNRVYLNNNNTGINNSGRYFYYNVLEEIDEVGEYFVDDTSGMIYVYLPEEYEDMHITFAQTENWVISATVDYYTFDGLMIESSIDGLVNIVGDYNTVQNCTLRNSGHGSGIFTDGMKNFIYNNELYFLGAGGISATGGNNERYIPSDTVIDNNLIHDYAELQRVYNGGIGVGAMATDKDYVGFTVSHNEIYNGPHLAISYFAIDAIFEYNYIHDVCYEAGDAGAVYDGTWLTCGMIFRHNVIKDVKNEFNIFMNPNGYYCDDSGGGKQVYSNLFINIDGDAICTSGQDNFIHDNILIDTRGIYTDSRSYYKFPNDTINGWTTSCIVSPSGPSGLWAWMMLEEWNPGYATEEWAVRYPWTMILKTTNVYDLEDNFVGYGFGDSTIRQNIVCSMNSIIFTTKTTARLINIRDNIRFPDIASFGFKDYDGGDYTVTDASKIYHEFPGFKPCDFENVGVRYTD